MKLIEARLSRILKHINDNEICFISACRSENSNKENKKFTEELAADIRSLGYSYITVLGGFTENRGKENEADIVEASFFVINNGNIIDIGTHDELLDRCVIYQEIHYSQNKKETK